MLPLMDKLEKGGSARIVVLGGSMTLGTFAGGKGSAWSARFVRWLRARYPQARVELLNLARGGATTNSIVAGVGLLAKSVGHDIDLVMLDTLVNDRHCATNGMVLGSTKVEGLDVMSMSYESLVQAFHLLLPDTPVFALLTDPSTATDYLSSMFLSARLTQLKVIEHYDIPRLDYADFAWRQVDHSELPPPDAGKHLVFKYWDDNGKHHPSWRVHQTIADMLANAWGKAWAIAQAGGTRALSERGAGFWPRETVWPEANLSHFRGCLHPTSYFSAFNPPHGPQAPSVLSGNWRLFEDRPNKPGWIADAKDSTIRFPLHFGPKPRLSITYLRSYEGLGEVEVAMNNHSGILSGLWDEGYSEKVSQSYSLWFDADRKSSVSHHERYIVENDGGFAILPGASMDFDVRVLQGKFKIIEVMAC